jgi:glycosyltransferase involved in cell wall biosynthesis
MLVFVAFKVLRAERPDVIHTHATEMALAVSFAARHYRIPIVHTFHIVTFYYQQQPMLRRKTELLMAKAAHATLITAPNRYDVDRLKKAGLTQVQLMPNGIDLEFWKNPSSTRKRSQFTFVTAGRLEQQKGYEYLIKAAGLLKQTNENFQVVVIGDGSQKARLYELARLSGVLKFIVFAGRKPADQIREIYASADAAVFPSLWETTPLTLLEAWAMQLPTIITRVGILRGTKVYDNSVILVKRHDQMSLAKAMSTVLSNGSIRNNLATSGIQQVQAFTWDKIYGIANGLYKDTVVSYTRVSR